MRARNVASGTQTFTTDAANQLTAISRNSSLTVAGALSSPASSLTVNGQSATIYGDSTFAVSSGLSIIDGVNTFEKVATVGGVPMTNSLVKWLPASLALGHDLNGNLISDGLRGYEYDCANQLVRITATNEWKSEFGYDGFGRRRVRKEYTWNGGLGTWHQTNEVRYVYDGMLVLQEWHYNPQLSLTEPQQTVTYTRGLDLSGTREGSGGIGGLLARTDESGSTYYHADGNGNVTALIDWSGASAARYLYDPYGNLLAQSGTMAHANVYRFSSKEHDANSGLYYFGFRFYEPNLQRWLNRDPQGERGGLNLYEFVGNDPINRIDPLGLAWYDYVPGIGPGIAQARGEAAIQAQLARYGYGSMQEFQLDHPGYGGTMTSGNLNAVQGVGDITSGAANLYLTAATSVTPTAAGARCVDALSRAAAAADRAGLTKAGRSLTKHGAGARPGNTLFPAARGNTTAINEQAQAIVDDILTTPGTTIQNSYRGRFGNTIEITAPDGRGIVYDANGNFLFFKE